MYVLLAEITPLLLCIELLDKEIFPHMSHDAGVSHLTLIVT